MWIIIKNLGKFNPVMQLFYEWLFYVGSSINGRKWSFCVWLLKSRSTVCAVVLCMFVLCVEVLCVFVLHTVGVLFYEWSFNVWLFN